MVIFVFSVIVDFQILYMYILIDDAITVNYES